MISNGVSTQIFILKMDLTFAYYRKIKFVKVSIFCSLSDHTYSICSKPEKPKKAKRAEKNVLKMIFKKSETKKNFMNYIFERKKK